VHAMTRPTPDAEEVAARIDEIRQRIGGLEGLGRTGADVRWLLALLRSQAAEIARLLAVVDAARKLIDANDNQGLAHERRPDIAFRDLRRAIAALAASATDDTEKEPDHA